jgi:uncharacterized OB-fold protein
MWLDLSEAEAERERLELAGRCACGALPYPGRRVCSHCRAKEIQRRADSEEVREMLDGMVGK